MDGGYYILGSVIDYFKCDDVIAKNRVRYDVIARNCERYDVIARNRAA